MARARHPPQIALNPRRGRAQRRDGRDRPAPGKPRTKRAPATLSGPGNRLSPSGTVLVTEFRLEKVRLGAHICGMRSVRAGMPMVEVTAPDGTKSAWAAAVAPSAAVEAVKKMIPPDHVATLSNQRLPIGPQTEGMRRGEVRKVEP